MAYNIIEIILGIALYVLYVIGLWKMFEKAGRRKWLSIIPIVNTAILCLIGWKRIWPFVLEIVFGIAGFLLILISYLVAVLAAFGLAGYSMSMIVLVFIGLAMIVAALVIYIMMLQKVSKAFGHGAGFTVGQIFVPFIIYPVIGWGSSEYQEEPQ